MSNRCRARLLIVAVVLAVGLCGCGRVKNPVAGVVTRADGPPPSGLVELSPDLDKGNDGPTVTLWLKEGQFSSAKEGKSMRTGEHHVTVVVAPDGAQYGASRERRFHVNVPEGGKTDLNFDVTRKPKAKKPKAPEPDEDE